MTERLRITPKLPPLRHDDAAICFDDSSGKDFTISVSGTNSLTSTATYGYAIRSTGSGKVSVVGSGNGAALNLTVPSTYDTGYAVSVKGKEAVLKDLSMQISGYLGIVVNGKNTAGDALTIDKCKITFDGTAIDQAIWVYNESGDGTISIKNGSNLSGKGAILCYGYGTASGDADVSIENSTVILSGCTSAPASGKSRHAMEVLSKCGDSTLTIDGSTVNVTASNGVLANGNGADGINVGAQETANEKGAAKVEIKNSSTVTATGCANGLNIFTWGDQTTNPYGTTLTVDSSTLTASATNNDAGAYGIVAYAYKKGPTTVTFKDSNITASAKKTAGICLGAGENYNSNVGNLTLNSLNSTIITSGPYGLNVSAETEGGNHDASQTVSVTGGSFSSTGGVYVLGDDLDSSALTFSDVDVTVDIHGIEDVTEAIVTGKLNIDSGAYNFVLDPVASQTAFDVVTGNITGGKYNIEPDEDLIAEDYAVSENTGADNVTYPYLVTVKDPVASYVDENDVTKYAATLQDAVNSAKTGTTVTMLKDVALGSTKLTFTGKTLTFDLNGHAITGTVNELITLSKDGTVSSNVTIKDSVGTGSVTTTTGKALKVTGTLAVKGGTFSPLSKADAKYASNSYPIVEEYTISGSSTYFRMKFASSAADAVAKLEFTSSNQPYDTYVGTANTNAIINKLIATGNKFTATFYKNAAWTYDSYPAYGADAGKIVSGELSFWTGSITLNEGVTLSGSLPLKQAKISVYGPGSLADDFLTAADGFAISQSAIDGGTLYTSKAAPYFKDQNNKEYTTLAEAFAAAKAANEPVTLTLLKDYTSSAVATLDTAIKPVTLDLNGKTLTYTGTSQAITVRGSSFTVKGQGSVSTASTAIRVENDSTVTIQGDALFTTSERNELLYVQTGTLNIEGGTFESTNAEGAGNLFINCKDDNYNNGDAVVTVIGGTFVGFDPQDNTAEGAHTDFTESGYVALETATPGTFEVKAGYNVTFDADGGQPTPDPVRVAAGATVAEPTAPTKEGSVFGSWSVGTDTVTFPYTPSADVTLKALWKEITPSATFTATGADTGTLAGVTAGMKYSLDGTNWTDITGSDNIDLTGLSAGTIQVVKKGNGTTTVDSDPQTITVTKAETPNLTVTQPTVIDGKGTVATTTAHEYSSDNGSSWTACTANQEFEAGSYLIRVKASGTVLASENQTVKIAALTEPVITGADLVLNASLDFRFYVALPVDFDSTGAHMVFTIHGRNYDIPFVDAKTSADTATQGQKIFSCPVYSIEMAEPVAAVFHYTKDSQAKTATLTSSVKAYLDKARELFPDETPLIALIDAVQNYGHYIQPYLARLHNFTVGDGGYAEMPAASGITPATAADLDNFKTNWTRYDTDLLESVTYYDTFDTSTYLNVQVKLKSARTLTATVDGKAVEVTELGGNVYAVRTPGIAANNLDIPARVVFSAGSTVICDIDVSTLTYVRAVLASRSELDELNALTAFYNYYTAAKDYAG